VTCHGRINGGYLSILGIWRDTNVINMPQGRSRLVQQARPLTMISAPRIANDHIVIQ